MSLEPSPNHPFTPSFQHSLHSQATQTSKQPCSHHRLLSEQPVVEPLCPGRGVGVCPLCPPTDPSLGHRRAARAGSILSWLQLAAARRPSAARVRGRARAQGTVRLVVVRRRLLSHPFPGVPARSGVASPWWGGGRARSPTTGSRQRPRIGVNVRQTTLGQRAIGTHVATVVLRLRGRLSRARPLLPLPVAF